MMKQSYAQGTYLLIKSKILVWSMFKAKLFNIIKGILANILNQAQH